MTGPEKVRYTPIPWLVSFNETGGYDCMTGAWEISAGSRIAAICDVDQGRYGQNACDYDYRSPEAKANADLIVRAVNHHEELVLLAQRYLALRHCAVTDDYNRMTRKELKRSYDGLEEWCREVLAKLDAEVPYE